MVSEKITVGLATTNPNELLNFLRGEGILSSLCSEVGDKGVRYIVAGPTNESYKDVFKNCDYIEEYEFLGANEGDLDSVENYRNKHSGVSSNETHQ